MCVREGEIERGEERERERGGGVKGRKREGGREGEGEVQGGRLRWFIMRSEVR